MKEVNKSQEIKKLILKTLTEMGINVAKVFLFGSRAKGKETMESDWDILVVLKDTISQEEKRKIWVRIFSSLHRNFSLFSFDIIIKSEKVFEEEKDIVNTISNEVYLEGVEL